MRKTIFLLINILFISVLLNSCRSTDTENAISSNGTTAVSFNLMGTDYAEPKKLSAQGFSNYDNSVQRHIEEITPSSFITAELSSLPDSKVNTTASSGLNPVAAVTGDPIASGVKFRVIAYRSNGNYHTHQDYTVGQTATPMMLDSGAAYNIVAYSYGTTTLPDITQAEKSTISSATVNYDNTNRDFMYQKIALTPTFGTTNTLNITLRHKVAQITVVMSSSGLGNITGITNALLTPHYSNGVFALSSGTMSGRSTLTSGISLTFPSSGFPGTTQTSSPVFVNADTAGNATGGLSASITIAGTTTTTKTISLTNVFKITPENKSNLTISLRTCGAYIGDNTNPANYKEFSCQNLGATSGVDPFSPEAGNHGAKYQWGATTGETGRYLSQATDQSDSGVQSGWNSSSNVSGSWSDTSKTAKDPCPTGYRVPTRAQWQAVIANNTFERVSSWDSSSTNYSAALYIKNRSGIITLMLPAAGSRIAADGTLDSRGNYGFYWSSTATTSLATNLGFSYTNINVFNNLHATGMSVRCIKG